MDSVGEGEGGMTWENGIEIRIISYMERVTSPGSMHDTGCLGVVHFDVWQNQYNIVKFKNKIKFKKINKKKLRFQIYTS